MGKEHLRDIEKMSEQHALCIDATRVAPAHLKSRGNQVDRMMDQLGKAVINWTEVLALVEPTAAITPTTTHFENKTIGWIEEYEQKIKDLDESFRGSNVFSMEVGHDDALKMLDTNEKVFVEETKIFEKNAHLCVVFEFPEKINTSQEILQTTCWTAPSARYRGASPSTTRPVRLLPPLPPTPSPSTCSSSSTPRGRRRLRRRRSALAEPRGGGLAHYELRSRRPIKLGPQLCLEPHGKYIGP